MEPAKPSSVVQGKVKGIQWRRANGAGVKEGAVFPVSWSWMLPLLRSKFGFGEGHLAPEIKWGGRVRDAIPYYGTRFHSSSPESSAHTALIKGTSTL